MTQTYQKPTVDRQPVGALSRKDAASYIGVSTRQLDNYAKAGELRRVKLGTKTVYRVVDLDAFLQSRLQPLKGSSGE